MKAELWKNDLLPGVTIASNSYSGHQFQPHFHDHYVIMIVDEGVNEGVCEKKRFQVTANDILMINPGEIHTGSSYQGKHLRYSAFYVDVDFFTQHLPLDRRSPPVFTSLLEKNQRLAYELKDLILSTRADESPFELEEKKVKTFGELMTFAGSNNRDAIHSVASSVQKIKTFIREQYNQQFSLEALAKYAGLSQYHLIRTFKHNVGITPFQFLRNYRIERAKRELLTNKAIAEVALDVGFYDQSHFHKHFKLVTGITPREFQRQ